MASRSAGSGIEVAFGRAVRALAWNGPSPRKASPSWLAGLHRTYVGDIERGEPNVSLVNIERLSIALGVRPSELLARTEQAGRRSG